MEISIIVDEISFIKNYMELLTVFIFCFGLFCFFALSEVVKLKKEVKKLNGIVDHLLQDSQKNQ